MSAGARWSVVAWFPRSPLMSVSLGDAGRAQQRGAEQGRMRGSWITPSMVWAIMCHTYNLYNIYILLAPPDLVPPPLPAA